MVSQLGLIGVGVMGRNLALNILDHDFSLSAHDISEDQLDLLQQEAQSDQLHTYTSLKDFVSSLERPRKILMLVTAGELTEQVISQVTPFLQEGDILMDGGNANFQDTNRRCSTLEKQGIHYLGIGVSGGAEGARTGPSLMPGGSREGWEQVKPFLQAIAAKTSSGEPCCQYIGKMGAGNFVKTIHNGIEYSDMQLISEIYHLLQATGDYLSHEMGSIFESWNLGRLDSYLVEITATILQTVDTHTGKPVVDIILDSASQKGTGKWSVHSALDLGIPSTMIATAVFQRFISALKSTRTRLSSILDRIQPTTLELDASDLEAALYGGKLITYAQGFELLAAASKEYDWDLDLANIALVWSAGCIIRSELLSKIQRMYTTSSPDHLLLDRTYLEEFLEVEEQLRSVVVRATQTRLPVPGLSSSLAYVDSLATARLPANMIQAQREFFGSHGIIRMDDDKQTLHHIDWNL